MIVSHIGNGNQQRSQNRVIAAHQARDRQSLAVLPAGNLFAKTIDLVLGHFAQRINDMGQACIGIVIEQALVADPIGFAQLSASGIVGIAGRILIPDQIVRRCIAGQFARALGTQALGDTPLNVVTQQLGTHVGRTKTDTAGDQVPDGIELVMRNRAIGTLGLDNAVKSVVGIARHLIEHRNARPQGRQSSSRRIRDARGVTSGTQ